MIHHRLVWRTQGTGAHGLLRPLAMRQLLAAQPEAEPVSAVPTYYSHVPPRDEAIFLLHIGAEIEHSLMVQYLYAAYSIDPDSAPEGEKEKARLWQRQILEIAREEMGHLATVQNLLRLIDGPLAFDRQDCPYQSDFYPFAFELEPLSLASVAKYVVSEMPERTDVPEIEEIKDLATKGNAGKAVNRVGKLYEAIIHLFEKLEDGEFNPESVAYQADFDTWGRDYARVARGASGAVNPHMPELIIRPVYSRTTALAALKAVAEQGEGNEANDKEESHFRRYVDIYRALKANGTGCVRAIACNPVTMEVTADPDDGTVTPITHPTSRLWAQLFNSRYRLLLSLLTHVLQVEGPLSSGPAGATSPRGRLVAGTFGEMYQLRALAGILICQPVDEGSSGLCCGPPFELPYSLTLPDLPSGRWKAHRDVILGSELIIDSLRQQGVPETKYLDALQFQNRSFLEQISAILATLKLPRGLA